MVGYHSGDDVLEVLEMNRRGNLTLLHSCSHGVIYWEMFKSLPLTGWFAKLTAG